MPEVCGQDRKKQVKSIQVFHTYVLYAKIGSKYEEGDPMKNENEA
jgi:hypothetical protein